MSETLEVEDVAGRAPAPRRRVGSPPRPAGFGSGPLVRGLLRSAAEALDQRRHFILLPFAMVAGLVTSVGLQAEVQPAMLWAVAGLLVVVVALSARSLVWMRFATAAGAFWLGMCLLPVHGALFGTPMLGKPAYGTYEARVDEIVEATSQEQRVLLSDISAVKARELAVRRARVLIKGGPPLRPGDRISASFRLAEVPGPVLPGAFDTQFHAYFDGIGAYGNAIHPPTIVVTGPEAAPERIIDGIRTGIAQRIDAVLAQPSAGVARAIVNGDQSAVSDETRTTMATAGIAHVLSVSGLHLTIVAGGVFWALRLLLAGFDGLARRVSVKRVAAAGGIVAALFYFSISGGNVAAFRSTLMILLVFGAVLVGRRALTMRNVAIAGIIVTVVDPASVFRPSYQLSFAAVVALVGAYENLRNSSVRDASLAAHALGYAKGIVVTSLVACAATLLFSIYHFQQTSPLGVVGNLVTLPLVGFVMMPAAALSVVAMPFGVERPFLLVLGWSIDRMLDVAGVVATWSQHLRAAPLLTPTALLIGLGALCWFAFFRDRWRLLGPAAAVPLVLLFAVDHPPDMLVADTTQAIAVRGVAGLELADGKPSSFALGIWRETYGDPIAIAATTSCDSLACIGESSVGFTYAIIERADAFAEECGRADLIISRVPAPVWCASKLVIDPETLSRHGVQWLRWDAGRRSFEVRSAMAGGDRPWRVKP